MIAWLRVAMQDRVNAISFAAALVTPMAIIFMVRCLMWHRENRTPWDTASFSLHVGGVLTSVWFLVESILNVGSPPGHWRLYVIVLSFALMHNSTEKVIGLWAITRKPPASTPVAEGARE